MLNDATKQVTKKVLHRIKQSLQNGLNFSEALEAFPQYFNPVFVGLIKSGENSSQLDKVLDELARQLQKEYSLRKKIKSALAYPIILLWASFGIVLLLVIFVLPRLSKTFVQMHANLPWMTKVLMAISDFVSGNFFIDVLIGACALMLWWWLKFTPQGKHLFARVLFGFAPTRRLVQKIILVRITRTLSGLLTSATGISDALDLTKKVADNHIYEQALERANNFVRSGRSISESWKLRPDLFPLFLTSMVAVGEKTGTLDQVLKTFADFYEEEVDGGLKDLATMLEPAMLIVMGVVVGGIALAVLLPIYQLVGNFV
jgi:type II secretory pathway component PulF